MSAALTREGWLTLVADKYLLPRIAAADAANHARPHVVRYSIGFPKGSRGGNSSIGQCWGPTASADNAIEIFISPVLDAFDAIHVLLHELVHAQVGTKHGHKGAFKQVAVAAGLAGRMTATVPGPQLTADIKSWLKRLSAFPGAQMTVTANPNKQTTRLIKCACPECGYTVRTTARWLEIGAPVCPEHESMEVMA